MEAGSRTVARPLQTLRDLLALFRLVDSSGGPGCSSNRGLYCGGAALLIQPFCWGVLFWTWVGYFNPQDFTYGVASKIPFALLIAISTIAGLVATKRKQIPPPTVETGLLLLLWFWFCVTTLNVLFSPTLTHHWTDSIDFLWQHKQDLLMVFVALALVTDSKRLRWWYLVTAGSFAIFALKGSVFGVLTGGQDKIYGPKNSMIYDNNDFGLAMNMAASNVRCLRTNRRFTPSALGFLGGDANGDHGRHSDLFPWRHARTCDCAIRHDDEVQAATSWAFAGTAIAISVIFVGRSR